MGFDPTQMLLLLPGIIVGLTVHEYAHARVADYLGDPTSAYSGRLTLNPLAHVDIMGFLMLLLAGFGWAKPVPINPLRFRGNMRTGVALVSVAGPAANLIMAFTGAFIFYLSFPGGVQAIGSGGIGIQMLKSVIWINVVLAAFNLIPIPPLDGSKILASMLPAQAGDMFLQLERYGPLILIALIFTGFTSKLLSPILSVLSAIIFNSAEFLAQIVLSLF
jgi:Zn-dependent protease